MRNILLSKKLYLFLIIFSTVFSLLSLNSIAQTTQTFTASGTFTVPSGINSITVECWGAGGRGGSAIQNGQNEAGGGGGGGAYSKKVVSVTAGTPYSVNVGAGGFDDTNLNGGDSYFNNISTVVGHGGLGVVTNTLTGGSGGSWSASDGDSGFSGGSGGIGVSSSYGGGGGSSAGTGSIGTNGNNSTSGIAPAGGGNGGGGGTTNPSSGTPGTAPGGGGGGATKGNGNGSPVGSSGANGQVKVTYNCPTYSLTGTSVTTPVCQGNSSTVTLASSTTNLPVGTYTVTYNLSAPNAATGNTASMTVTSAGTGTFTTNLLANSGNTTVTITNLQSGNGTGCNSAISTNNTASITVASIPAQPSAITGNTTPCPETSENYSVTNVAGVTYTWTFPSGWTQTGGGTTNSVIVTVGSVSGNISVTPSNTCVNGTARTLAVTTSLAPTTTGVKICQGGSGSLTVTSACSSGVPTSIGPTNAGTGADNNAVGTGTWTNTGNITTVGTPYATQNLASNSTTHYLKATNYGFAIPIGATINGITVVINRQVASTSNMFDNVVSLLKAGVVTGSNLKSGNAWPNTFGTATYGGAANLWGTTWTAADINAANFGVVLSGTSNSGSTRQVDVDYMQITVTYTLSGTLNWYTAFSGGTLLGSGTPFNPVGIAGSGLANTNTPGTYTFYAECSTTPGCRTATDFVINPLPTITTSATASSVCFGNSIQTTPLIYSATTNAPTTYSIAWNPSPANSFVTVTDAALPVIPITISVPASTASGTYTGTITVKNANNCISTGTNFTVTVNPLPTITTSASATNVCFNSSIQTTSLTYSATTNAPTTYSIAWNPSPANSFVTVTDAALTASPITISVPASTVGGTYTGTITVKNANGCIGTGTSFNVTVNTLTNLTGLNTSAAAACTGTSSKVTVSATTLTAGTYTVNYTLSGANSQAATNATMTVVGGNIGTFNTSVLPNSGSTTITINSVASGTCSTNATTGNSSVFAVTNLPAATISYSGNPLCKTSPLASVTLTGTAGGGYSSSPAGLTIDPVTGSISANTSNAGNYTVTYSMAATGGCAAQTATTSVTILPTNCANRVFYSLKSGSWDDPTVWTLDPSGSLPLNPGNLTPTTSATSAYDEVVVLSGRTVTVPTNNKVNNHLTVIGTLNFGATTGNSFTTINGTGRIRLSGDNFPTGDASNFITAGQGEGIVEYFGTTRSLTAAHTFFNVEINMTTGNVLSLVTDYMLNGNLTVTDGTLQINNNASIVPVNFTIRGDITVAALGKIATGTANARHQLNIYGNFINSGEVRFTNRAVANYSVEATDGIVDANFLNTQLTQNIFCRGITNFYRIEINKGTDNTYTLNLDATDPANFNLFGYANEDHLPVAQLMNNNNALGLVSGTVRIGNSIVIPTLSTANNYNISEDAQLWINGGTVQKNSGQTIAVYGKIRITTGLLEAKVASGITLAKNGTFNADGGISNINQLRTSDLGAGPNNGGYIQTGGDVIVLGGTTNNDYYVFSLPSTASVFNMSGGNLKVNTAAGNGAILINSDPGNVKVTGGSVIAETASTENFVITSRAPFWNLSFKNNTAVARQFTLSAASNIGPLNINISAQPLQVLNDFRIWGQESGGSTYPTITFDAALNDTYIGGSLFVEKGAQYLAVSGGTAPYDATANQPTGRNTTYFNKTAGTDAVEELYTGETAVPLELGKLVIDRTSGYEVKITSSAARVNESVAIDVNGDASVLSGILNQNLYTIRTWGAIVNNDRMGTWYPGVTPSNAQIQIVENPLLTLTAGKTAVFGNVQVNVTSTAKITFANDIYIERMEYVKGLIYLKGYNLKVDYLWNIESGLFEDYTLNSYLKVLDNGFSASSMIFTDGKASDAGLSIKVIANSQTENQYNILNNFGPTTFPIGFTPDGGTTLYFRPAQVVVKNFSSDGYITIRPVFGSLQTTNQAGGEVLQHYWRVSNSGFTTTPLPTIAYRFYYRNKKGVANVDLVAGAANEASYVPGMVLDESPYTRGFEPLAQNDLIKAFGAGGNSRIITINGASANGLFSPAATGTILQNSNYTAGVLARFNGSVFMYYTRDYQQEPRWTDANAWTRSDILNPLYAPHDSRQPAATTVPGAGDVAVIGWVPWTDTNRPTLLGQPHGMWIDGNSQQVAELVFTKMTDALGNPVARNYRSNFQFRPTLCINNPAGQLVTKLVKGEGLFWNRYSDPDYTQMDIGDFARQDSSYVIYENSTNGRIINNTATLFPNLYISNDSWGAQDRDFTFAKDITTTGNVELLGNVNLILPNGATGNITSGRNLIMFRYLDKSGNDSGGGASLRFANSGTARIVTVKGDLIMANAGSIIDVNGPNATAPLVTHELHIYGNIIQGTTAFASTGLDLWSNAINDRITLYLDGSNSMTYNLVNGTIPDLYRLVVNKGNNQSTTAQFNTDFNLNGPTTGPGVAKALELKNGTFIYNNTNAARILTLTSGNDYFGIPSTAGLNIKQGTARANGASGISLDGVLTIGGGTLDMVTGGAENPIEYSASGNATISITSGNLNVGGQIRRSLTSDAGILLYNQSGGSVVVGQNAASANNRGVFEILNPGSSFSMTTGDLYIVRAQTTPTVSAFYFNPETYNIGATANIHIGHSSTPANQTIGIYAGKPLPKLRVNNQSNNNPIAKLEVVPATITSLLQIDANASFNANGIDLLLNGDMTSSGTFIPAGNTTYLSGSNTQTITGNGSSLNFYSLDKTQTNNVILNGSNTPLLISNEFFLRSGIFTTSNNTVTVKGDILNDAVHIFGGVGDGILLNGTMAQTLTGNGTFGKLTINNSAGIEVPVANQFKITNSLKMQTGVFNIGKNLLDFGVNAIIEQPSPFSVTNMITTNISFTDNGIRKTFPVGASSFIFPLGSTNKYTPVTLSVTANGNNTGSITVKPANEIHPSIIEDSETGVQIIDKDNALQYYWTLKASGITGFSGTSTMKYIDTDVKVTSPYTVADYFPANLLADALGNWLKFPKTDFDEVNKNMIFTFSSTDDTGISADYTAGAGDASLNGAIPNKVARYETNNNGDWTTGTIWTPNVSGGPRGAIAKINAPHTVVVSTDYLAGYMTEIYGVLKLNSTVGHRLGIVNGNGTIYSEIGDLPAAVYDNFFSSAGGTLEFGGIGTNYEFLGNVIEVNHLKLSGNGERRFPNNNLILNGDLNISGDAGLLAINYYDRKLSVKGNIYRTGGTYDAGNGPGATVALIGTLPQSITGSFSNSNALNNLEVNNTNDVTIINDLEIDRELKLSNGLINTSAGSLFRINYGATVSPANGSPLSFVNGTLTKEMITGNSFTFPIGNATFTKAHGPVSLLNVNGPTGLNDWNATYFYANPDAIGPTANLTIPISTVSNSEYWQIQAPTGGQSNISILLDGSSDVGSTIPDLDNLRIVGWNALTAKWEVVGTGATISGINTNGTITTTSPVNFGSYSYFTLASVTPLSVSSASFTSPSLVNLCNGSSTTMVVAFSGTAPWALTYKAGATTITTPALATSPYSISVSPSATTVYTLTGITANGKVGTINGTSYVTVNVSPIPTVVLSSNDADNTICQGNSITFTATAGLLNYRFRINGTIIQNGASNTFTTTTLATGIQSVDVIGTNAGACSSTSSAITVTVNPLPVAAGLIGGSPSTCKGVTGGYSISAIANATSYSWSYSGTNTTITGSDTSVTLNFSGTATSGILSVYGINSCGNGTPSTISINVSSGTAVSQKQNIGTGPISVCLGTGSYSYTVPVITNATGYKWYYSGNGVTEQTSGSAVSASGFTTGSNTIILNFSLSATSGNLTVRGVSGCPSGDGPLSDNYPITANSPPTASIVPIAPSTCSGTMLTITATPSGGNGGYTNHLWTGTGAASLSNTGITNPTFINATGGAYDLTYTVTDSKGCKGTAGTTVTVFQAPVADAGPDALGICTGTLPIQLTGATAGGSYSGTPAWSGTGGIWTQNPDPSLATFTPSTSSGTITATLTLTGTNGCSTVFDTRTIKWNKTPDQPGIISGTAAQCPGLTGQTYSISLVPNATTYAWTVPTGWTITNGATTNSITVSTGAAGQGGNITVTAGNIACGMSTPRILLVTVNQATVITAQSTTTQSQCINGTFAPITVTAAGTGTLTYQWYSNVSALNSGGSLISGATSASYTPSAASAGTLYYYCLVHSGCGADLTSTISGAFIVIGDQLWTGAVNDDWNNAGNWSCGYVPLITTNVTIPGGKPRYPALSTGAIDKSNNLTIENGGSVTVDGNTLQIAGIISNSGTFTASSGTIEMVGSLPQDIGAGGIGIFAGDKLKNLIINKNAANVNLKGPLMVSEIVKVVQQNGDLLSNGNLTLISTATKTALIDGTGNGQVLGSVTMQRYLPKAYGYKYFSSPFQDAKVAEFSIHLSTTATIPTFYAYDEENRRDSAGVWAYQSGWVNYTTTSNLLNPLKGYAANFGGDFFHTTTFEMTGQVNNGNLPEVTLYNHQRKYTDGFNLIGNPYPSPIDWNASGGWIKTNIDNALYFFNAGTTDQYSGVYSSYVNGVKTGNADNIIASMQGFFIHVAKPVAPAKEVTGKLLVTNSIRINNLNPLFKDAIIDNRTILRFAANFETKNVIEDVAIIYFDDHADRRFEKELDALKMLNTDLLVPNIYTLTPDPEHLSINGMPFPGDSITKIPLGITTLSDGWINFKAKDISKLPSDMHLYLIDAQYGITTNLKQHSDYRFYLKKGIYLQRFTLVFSLSGIEKQVEIVEKMFTITRSGDRLFAKVNLPFNTRGDLLVTNMQGKTLLQKGVFEMEAVEIDPNVGSGIYIVTVISGKRRESEKILIRKDYE